MPPPVFAAFHATDTASDLPIVDCRRKLAQRRSIRQLVAPGVPLPLRRTYFEIDKTAREASPLTPLPLCGKARGEGIWDFKTRSKLANRERVMKMSRNRIAWAIVCGLCGAIGCGGQEAAKKEGPTYEELVTTLNQELGILEKLETKRKEMIAQYETEKRPDVNERIGAIGDLIGSIGDAGKKEAASPPADPNAALDQAVGDAERTAELTSKLLKSISEGEGEQAKIVYSKEFQKELDALDAEIEAQKGRVERARQARDAAEAKRQ